MTTPEELDALQERLENLRRLAAGPGDPIREPRRSHIARYHDALAKSWEAGAFAALRARVAELEARAEAAEAELARRGQGGQVDDLAMAIAVDMEVHAAISTTTKAKAEAIAARIRAALVSPGDGWRSMDSAPRDGRTVLLHGLLHQPSIDAGTPETVMAYWTEYNGGGWVWHGSLAITFTHWMPLPATPASEGA